MRMVDDNNNFWELDYLKKQDLIYDNSEDKARLDPKLAGGAKKNIDISEGQNFLKSEDKILLPKPANCY